MICLRKLERENSMKYKYEFEVEKEFEKGLCHRCPLSYDVDSDYGYDTCCVLLADYDECPLEEVKDERITAC